jgi:DNA-binding CsgD family transcriptional regulator/PAS domain-containing protein
MLRCGRATTEASMDRLQHVTPLLGLVFEAAVEPRIWPQALNALADAIGAHVAGLASFDTRTHEFDAISPRHDPDYILSYRDYWARQNPVWPGSPQSPAGTLFTPDTFVRRDAYTRTDFFQEWVVPQGIEATMGTNALVEDGVTTILTLNRSWRVGDFTPDEMALFAALIPHFQRAVQLQHRLAMIEMHRSASVAAFDRLRDGVVLADDGFRILFANRAAEEILADGDGLRRDPDGIAATTSGETEALRRLIAGRDDGHGNGKRGDGLPGSGGRCRITRGAGRAPLAVLVVPIRSETTWITVRRPVAVLFVTDPDRVGRGQRASLDRRFGLTRAETAFVGEIVKGDGLQAAADRLGISLATARTHLRHAFEKTGTSRQAELVRLAMQSQVALRDDD